MVARKHLEGGQEVHRTSKSSNTAVQLLNCIYTRELVLRTAAADDGDSVSRGEDLIILQSRKFVKTRQVRALDTRETSLVVVVARQAVELVKEDKLKELLVLFQASSPAFVRFI